MRDTIDFGVDLGTTNSAIAVVEGGSAVVIKNNDGWDTTPSAVWIPKADRIEVGRRARERVVKDPENAAAEFKLEMGLADARKVFDRAGVSLTPQQLSAEVLRSLRADAAHHVGAPPRAAVITVPAAFALNQNKATTEAAVLAGFVPSCPLVQEPTAAAFAYGFQDASDRAYWMVFDFGGGTFDAAVVSKREGDLRVLNHAGDSYLGGKLIDWALVERVLAPAAATALDLPDFRRDNPRWLGNFATLKAVAEEAKIGLTRADQVEITTELVDAGGTEETFEYTLRRGELERIAEPFYVRAINFCRAALADASLDPADIDRLLLVGGVTLAPGLRERLADPDAGLGIELDVSLDPTTVVARGAALFASTVRSPDNLVPAAPTAGTFTVELAYEPSVTTTTPTIAGRLRGATEVDWTTYSVTLTNPEGRPPFRSGRITPNAAGAFATEVSIDAHRASRFTVELTDAAGERCPLSPDSLTLTHRDVEFGGVRLAHSLGIQLVDQVFAPMLRKGATLPATVREVFRTSSTLRRADADALVRIPVVQGERSRAERNRQVGMLEIRPRDVVIDLPAGTEVEVTFEVDESNLVTVVADVPLVQAQFEAEIDLDDVRTPNQAALRSMLHEAEHRLATLRGSVSADGSDVARQQLAKLDQEDIVATAREQVRAAGVDAGAAATAEERLRNLHADLDEIDDAIEVPVLVERLRAALTDAAMLVNQYGDAADRRELAELERRAGEAHGTRDPAVPRALIERTAMLIVTLERRGPDWPVRLFHVLRNGVVFLGSAAPLIRQGERAIAVGDAHGLDAVNQQLIRLLPQDDRDTIIGLVR